MQLVLATTNQHKLKEILQIWGKIPFEVLTLSSFPEIGPIEENGKTFTENALIKARTVSQKTGLMAIADDSGLEVDALEGRPGIYSARFAGENASDQQNLEKVLHDLHEIQANFNQSTARFRCVAALVDSSGKEITTDGTIEGVICESPRGKNGFGYDPIFLIPSEKRTLAEMSAEEKNQISHRAEAFRKMGKILNSSSFFDPSK